jgi:hypothetical protein
MVRIVSVLDRMVSLVSGQNSLTCDQNSTGNISVQISLIYGQNSLLPASIVHHVKVQEGPELRFRIISFVVRIVSFVV